MRGPDAPIAPELRRALRARRRRAFALCLRAWALTFVLAPALHLWGHRADHHHLADGTVVSHGEVPHDSDGSPDDLPHGDGGAAHFAVSLLVAPPAVLPPPPAPAPGSEAAPVAARTGPPRVLAWGLGPRGPPAA